MAVWRYVDLNLPEAQALADLTGVEQDLAVAESFCDLLMKELRKIEAENDKPDFVLLEALTAAASIRYARAFAKGSRTRSWRALEPLMRELPGELAADHQRIMDFRDKYIAHSVKRSEKNRVSAYLVPKGRGPRGVASISVRHDRLLSLGVEDAKRLKTLCMKMRARVSSLIEAEKAKVLDIAKKLPIDELYARIDAPLQEP